MTSLTTPGPCSHAAAAALRPLPHALGPQLQLWQVDLDAYAEQHGLEGLTADERQRAERLAFAHLIRRSLASRHALRHLLGNALGRSPHSLTIGMDRFGKPSLGDSEPLHFSVSHREQHALIGLHGQAALGVDLELVRHLADLDGLARACFSTAEFSDWVTLAGEARLAYFFRCWTRKEACVKALGVGLSAPLPAIAVGGRAPFAHSLQLNGAWAGTLQLEVHSLPLPGEPADGQPRWVAACAWTDAASVGHAHAAWG